MVPAGNKAKCLSSLNHTTKTIHHHHHRCKKTFFSWNHWSLFSIHENLLGLQFSHLNEHIISKAAWAPCLILVLKQKQPVTFLVLPIFCKQKKKALWWCLSDRYSIKNLNVESLIDVLLYSSDRLNDSKNKQILLHAICYIQATKHAERPFIDWLILFNHCHCVFLLYVY